MKAAAEELGVPYATLDRFSPAYGTGPRAVAAEPPAPSKARQEAAERLRALRADVDAKLAAAAKLEEALAELDAIGEPAAPKPRRRR